MLQLVIETITQKGLVELSAERIFKPLGMAHTSYVWQPAFEANYALGYDEQGQPLEKRKRAKAGPPAPWKPHPPTTPPSWPP